MGYLICDKCGGYYELQEGESLDDFENCQCGGELHYKKLIKSDNSKRKIDINALIIGILITSFLVSFSYIGDKYYFISYSAPFVGGFLTAYLANGSRKNRIFHSVVVMLIVSIGAPLLALLRMVILSPDKTSYVVNNLGIVGFIIFIVFMFTLILIFNFTGAVMGYLATIIKKKASYDELYYEDDINRKPSMILVIIGYVFAILGGIIGLAIGWHLSSKQNPNAKFHGRNITIIAIISLILWLILTFLYPNV